MNSRLKAGAMSYAIILSIVVGALCMSLIWITSAYRITRVNLKNQEKLVVNLLTGVQVATQLKEYSQKQLYQINSDSVFIEKSNWGLFNYSVVKAVKNGETLTRSFLSGSKLNEKLPTLYIGNNDKQLKLSGTTKLKGQVYVPNGRVERGYIQGKNYENEKLVFGSTRASEKQLPKLKEGLRGETMDDFTTFREEVFLDELTGDSVFSFEASTSKFSQNIPIELSQRLEGNLIIESQDSIFVSSEAKLNNIILKAPKIRFQKGFRGTVQVFASQEVILEENVFLKYPSSICLIDQNKKFHRIEKALVKISKGSSILGGVLVLSDSPDFRNLVKLDIEKEANIVGLVYNQGETQVCGKILGSLYSKKLYLDTKSSSYENHLLDAEINGIDIPEFFIYPSWLEGYSSDEKRLKWL